MQCEVGHKHDKPTNPIYQTHLIPFQSLTSQMSCCKSLHGDAISTEASVMVALNGALRSLCEKALRWVLKASG